MRKNESGQTLPLFGLVVMVLFGFLAMAVDLGQGYLERRTNQAGADAAAVAGMEAMKQGATDSGIKGAVKNVLIGSGFSSSSIVFLTSTTTAGTDTTKVYVNAQYGTYGASASCTTLNPAQYVGGGTLPSTATCIHVTVNTSKTTFFANVPIIGVAQIGAAASSSAGQVSINTGSTPGSNITGATSTGTTATFTFTQTSTAPTVGSTITISGVGPSGYNGNYTVVSSTTTTVTVSVTSNPGTYTGGGTITFNPISSVTTAACSNGTITFTFSSLPTAPTVGSTITVTGVTPSGYNGTYTVASATTTTVSVSAGGSCPGSYTSGGSIVFNSTNVPTPTPTPTTAAWDTGKGEGYAIWGGKRADNTVLTVGSPVAFFADSGWDTSNDIDSTSGEYDATNNYKGYADPQCFDLPLQSTCTGPNGALGNAPLGLAAGTPLEVVVVDHISHHGNENVLSPIGLANITVEACPSTPAYLTSGTHDVCGVITWIDTGQLNEGVAPTATPTTGATSTPTVVPTYLIGNTP